MQTYRDPCLYESEEDGIERENGLRSQEQGLEGDADHDAQVENECSITDQ
jgi:hypothetical protein